ncbi:MAG: ABC transporter substrate-binding protein [Treponema sp.]|nr:ABC transporter substrate-binding protein [Treponema sp.]
MKMKNWLTVVCVIAAAIIFTGCPGQTRSADTVIVGMPSQPVSLDPIMTNDQPSSQVMKQIYSTLVNLDEQMAPVPSLAESWYWEDPARLRLFLRQGINFHNGDTLSASDVQFSLERAAGSPNIGHITGMIASVDIVNDYEILITLEYPFVPFINHLGHTAMSIVSRRAVMEQGEIEYARNPVGTGPMQFVSWVTGTSLELTRFDDYFEGPARLENISFRFISDSSTRLITLETGEIDLIYGVAASDVSHVEASDLRMIRSDSLAIDYIGFNAQRVPFNDPRVRQAINYALDKEALLRAAYWNTGSVARGPINNMVWASAANRLEPFPFDQERARQLLAEAGFSNGFSTSIVTNEGNAQRLDVAEIIQNMLAQVGIHVDVRILEWAAYLEMTQRGEHDMFILGWVSVTGDPDYGMYPLFHTDSFGAAGNRTFYSNSGLDTLLDRGRQETDPAIREQIYFEAQTIIRDEAPWIFLRTGEELNASRPELRGFSPNPAGHHILWNIYFE